MKAVIEGPAGMGVLTLPLTLDERRKDALASLGLAVFAHVLAALVVLLAIAVSPYFLAGMVFPMLVFTLSCAGPRALGGRPPPYP